MCREPLRDAAVDTDAPQIAFGGEHDGVAVNCGVAVVTRRGHVRRRSRMSEGNGTENRDREAQMRDAFSYAGNSGLIGCQFPVAGSQ